MKQQRRDSPTYRLVLCALIAAVAMVLGYLESLVPIPAPIPGVKLGFANIAVLFALYALDARAAAVVATAKLLVVAFLFGNLFMALFSLGGTAVAYVVMVLLKRAGVGVMGVSAASAVGHNVGQLVVATFVLGTPSIWAYAPVLLVAGVVCGLVTGAIALAVMKSLSVDLR